jgi:hypothetical protein
VCYGEIVAIDLVATPSAMDFGPILLGQTGSGVITLSNPNAVPIEVTALSLSGDPSFTLVGPPAVPFTLAASGGATDITVECTPPGPGALAGSLDLVHDGTNSPMAVALDAEGAEGVVSASVTECVTPQNPCATIPVVYDRVETANARAATVTIQLSPELELCVASPPSIQQGDWLAGFANVFEVIDNGGGSYTIDQSILGDPCGVTIGGTLFTVQVQGTVTDGEGTIAVTALDVRDCLNVPIAASAALPAAVTLDSSQPSQVTDVVAAQVKTGNDESGLTPITLTFTTPVDAEAVEVWRAPFGNYPEYDDGLSPGTVPALPTSYPPPAPWELTGISASGESDTPPTRDFWYYVVYGLNVCATASEVSAMTGGTLNYHLADFHDGVDDCVGDNDVGVSDLSFLGTHYGAALADPPEPLACMDVGPTTDFSVDGRPTTDNVLDFEDLVLMALNWGAVARPAPGEVTAAVDTDAKPELELVLEPLGGGEVLARLRLAGNPGVVKAVHAVIEVEDAEVVAVEAGDLFGAQGQPTFFKHLPEGGIGIHAALLGRGATIQGDGDIATARLRAGSAVQARLALRDVRGLENQALGDAPGTTAAGQWLVMPTRFELLGARPNPFNPSTRIVFRLPRDTDVRIRIYDIHGRMIRRLFDERLQPGEHGVTWDGRNEGGSRVGSGLYFYWIQAGEINERQKLVLLK